VGDWWVEKWLVGRVIVCVMVADMFGGRKGERKGWTGRRGWGRRVGKEGCVSTFLASGTRLSCVEGTTYTWIFQAQSDTISTTSWGTAAIRAQRRILRPTYDRTPKTKYHDQ